MHVELARGDDDTMHQSILINFDKEINKIFFKILLYFTMK